MYDLTEINSIPCETVARDYGIELTKKGRNLWGKIRNEKTSSFSINTEKNYWKDFGSGEGGTVINLVSELEGISIGEAIYKIAKSYGIEKENVDSWKSLTDNQFKELGIQPEMATINFKFDLNKQSIEEVEKWSNKYGMPIRNLADKHPIFYNKMIEKIGVKTIKEERNHCYKLINEYAEATNKEVKDVLESFLEDSSKRIARKIHLLQKAIIPKYYNKNVDFSYLNINYKEELKKKVVDERPSTLEQLKKNKNMLQTTSKGIEKKERNNIER